MNKVAEGLRILLMYADFKLTSAPEQIFCSPRVLRDEHEAELLELGWFISKRRWSVFT